MIFHYTFALRDRPSMRDEDLEGKPEWRTKGACVTGGMERSAKGHTHPKVRGSEEYKVRKYC